MKRLVEILMPFFRILCLFVFCSGCSWVNSFFSSDFVSSSGSIVSSFRIRNASVSLEPEHESFSDQTSWRIEEAKVYQIKVCLEDLIDQNLVIGQRFEVLNEDKTHVFRIESDGGLTDVTGCIYWIEKMNYNYFGLSRYVSFERVIRPLGSTTHFGEARLKFAVNLWSTQRYVEPVSPINSVNHPSIFTSQNSFQTNSDFNIYRSLVSDSSSQDLPSVESILIQDDPNSLRASLIVTLESIETRQGLQPLSGIIGFNLKHTLNLTVSARVYDEFGGYQDLPLDTGLYDISAHLVSTHSISETSGGPFYCARLSRFNDPVSFHLTHTLLIADLDIDLQYTLNNESRVYLELEVRPKNLPQGVYLDSVKSYYSLQNSYNSVFHDSIGSSSSSLQSLNCQNNAIFSSLAPSNSDFSNLTSLNLTIHPMRTWDILPELEDTFKILNIDFNDESAEIRKLFLKTKICFSSDQVLDFTRLPSRFSLQHIVKAHDQRYLFRPFGNNTTDRAHILCSENLFRSQACNDESPETTSRCVYVFDRLRYKYYTKPNHSPLIMYKGVSPLFQYTPILFLKFDLYNIDKYGVNCNEDVNCLNNFYDHINRLIHPLHFTSSYLNRISFSEKSITFREEHKRARSLIEVVSPAIDRFLNRQNKYQINFRIEPKVSVPSHQTEDVSDERLRAGIYLLRAVSLKRILKSPHLFWVGFQVNNNFSDLSIEGNMYDREVEEKIEEMSSASDFIYLDGEEDSMMASLPFLMKKLKLTNVHQNLFVQYKVVNEKKLILIHLLSKIYGLKFNQEDSEHPLLRCFASSAGCGSLNNASWLNGSSRDGTFLKDYELPSSRDEFSTLIQAIDSQSQTTICASLDSLSPEQLHICKERIRLLSFFLDYISGVYTPTASSSEISRDDETFNSFFNNYTYFCSSPLYRGEGNCPLNHQMDELKNTLRSVLGINADNVSLNSSSDDHDFSLTQNYSIVDDFEKMKSALNTYLGFGSEIDISEEISSMILNTTQDLNSLSSTEKEKILILFLKILHSSSSFLSQIHSHHQRSVISVDRIIKSTHNLLDIAMKLDSDLYNKINSALYKNSSLSSPVYWTPLVFSGDHVMQTREFEFYKLSELNQEFSSDRMSASLSVDPAVLENEVNEEVRHYMIFQNCKICQSCELCHQRGSSQETCNSMCQSCDSNTSREHGACDEDHESSPSYIDYLLKREKRIERMESLSMCYGMIRSFLTFETRYISIGEESEFLDPFCEDLLFTEIVRISNIHFDDLEFDIQKILKRTFIEGCNLPFLSDEPSFDEQKEVFKVFCLNNRIFHRKIRALETAEDLSPFASFHYLLNHPERLDPVFVDGAEESGGEYYIEIDTAGTRKSAGEFRQYMLERLRNEYEIMSQVSRVSSDFIIQPDYEIWRQRQSTEYGFDLNETLLHFAREEISKEKLRDFIQNFNTGNTSVSWYRDNQGLFLNLCFYLSSRFYEQENMLANDYGTLPLYQDSIKCFLGFWYLSLSLEERNLIRSNIEPVFPFVFEKQYRVFEAHPKTNDNGEINQRGDATDIQIWPFYNLEASTSLSANLIYGFNDFIPILEGRSFTRISDVWSNIRNNRVLEFTKLRVERLRTNIEFKNYEECLVFYKNPKYYRNGGTQGIDIFSLDFHLNLLDALTFIEIGNPLRGSSESISSILSDFYIRKGTGIYLCDERVLDPNRTKEFEEQYFYLENIHNPQTVLDPTDRRSYPWSLSIRGVNPLSFLFRIILSDYYTNQIFQTPNRPDRRIGESTVLKLARSYRTFSLIKSYLASPQGIYVERTSDPSLNFQDWWREIEQRLGNDERLMAPLNYGVGVE